MDIFDECIIKFEVFCKSFISIDTLVQIICIGIFGIIFLLFSNFPLKKDSFQIARVVSVFQVILKFSYYWKYSNQSALNVFQHTPKEDVDNKKNKKT